MMRMTYADLIRPAARTQARQFDLALILGGSLLIALSAQIAVPLPFSPVPVTGQTLAVLLTGVLLGSRRGALAVLAYLAEGAMGMPVFAGGTGGAAILTGPTGGYLAGFVAAAALTGALAERGWDRRSITALLAMVTGNLVIYLFGLGWLSTFIGLDRVVDLGMVPFLPGDVAKIALATTLLPLGWRALAWAGLPGGQPRG